MKKVYMYRTVLAGRERIPSLSVVSESDHVIDAIRTSKDVYDVMNELFQIDDLAEEYIYVLSLDARNYIKGVFELGHGSSTQCLSSVRDAYKMVLLSGGSHMILVHNHPSGDVTPSNDDTLLTQRMAKAGNILDIPLSDHIICGSRAYFSYREQLENILTDA